MISENLRKTYQKQIEEAKTKPLPKNVEAYKEALEYIVNNMDMGGKENE